jgi:hypothetical protein
MIFSCSESGPYQCKQLPVAADRKLFTLIRRYDMQRNEICKHIIRKIRDYLHDPDCLSPHRKENRFVRKRSLSMLQVILFLFYSSKVSMYQNLASIIADFPANSFPKVSKQAISKARKGISLDAFYWLLDISVSIFFKCEPTYDLWHGLHLFAIDGTDIQLPMVKQCVKTFGSQRLRNSSEFPFGKGSYLYSVSARLVVDALLETSKYSERELALRLRSFPYSGHFRQIGCADGAGLLFQRTMRISVK